MPRDPKQLDSATLAASLAELRRQQDEEAQRRSDLTLKAAHGDNKAAAELSALRHAAANRQIEIADLTGALELACAAEEASQRNQFIESAKRIGEALKKSLDRADAAAVEMGEALRAFRRAAESFSSSRGAIHQNVHAMAAELASGGVPIDPALIAHAAVQHLPRTFMSQVIRDSRLIDVFPQGTFAALGAAGEVMIDWRVREDAARVADVAKEINEVTRALLAVVEV